MKRKISRWQIIKSYFSEIHVEDANSDKNNTLVLQLKGGRLKLSTRNAIYSYEDRYTTFSIAFQHIREHLKNINAVLILGFGMGSIAWILDKNHGISPRITGVEHDDTIVRFYNKYYNAANVNVVKDDALNFVNKDEGKYDLICVDIFKDALVPNKFETAEFLQNLRNRLQPNGTVLFNRLIMEKGLAIATKTFYEKTFKGVFENSSSIEMKGNWVLMGVNEERINSK
jgi:spermidine synthase